MGSAILGDVSLLTSESSLFTVGRYDVLDRSTPADLGMSNCLDDITGATVALRRRLVEGLLSKELGDITGPTVALRRRVSGGSIVRGI